MKTMVKGLIGPKGIILLCIILVAIWFRQGLIFAGAEEQLSFYNFTKSLQLFSYSWLAVGTGIPTFLSLSRTPYFLIFEPFYKLGVSSVILEGVTFLILILIGMLSVYFLLKKIVAEEIKQDWKLLVPFLGAVFYFLNPFSVTQIWGRGLAYQSFAFALIPLFLLFFIQALQKKNLVFVLIAAVVSFFLATAYGSPSVVITSWSPVVIYLIFYLYKKRDEFKSVIFAILAFTFLLVVWSFINIFWIYPMMKGSKEFLSQISTTQDSIVSLKMLSPDIHLFNVIRLIHKTYYDGTYGQIFNNFLLVLISWLLPIFLLFSISTFRKVKHFSFFSILLFIAIVICIGANFPTGWLLVWLFEKIPVLQALRNPYEKFGINLVIAFAPFFAIGLLVFSEKFAVFFLIPKLKQVLTLFFTFLTCVVLVWPMWKGSFAGGIKTNFWVGIPDYYKTANDWLNTQSGDFNILHLPLLPDEGITYTWVNSYEGVEASEFLFDKPSIARNTKINLDYYSVLLDRFGPKINYNLAFPNWKIDNYDFKDIDLLKELAKINVRYIILHYDTNFLFRGAKSPQETRDYLENQKGIKKIITFGELDIYKVEIPPNLGLIYSPDADSSYKKINTTSYIVDIKNAKGLVNIYFLQQFHPGWEAYIEGRKILSHKEFFSYANNWQIEKNGNFQVTIKYKPQDIAKKGWDISKYAVALTVISFIILTILKTLRRVRKQIF